MQEKIIVKGARQHNLKNINVEIPKNKLVVVTGVSGSGKSSLAFDTIFAEGQRRYVESLSAYARQFLGVASKPDVDSIEGLNPSISIDQKNPSQNPRSTVGTITEIYDFFRLLFARIGHPHCPICGREIAKLTLDEISNKIFELVKGTSQKSGRTHELAIFSPIVRQRKGEFKELFANLAAKGFSEVQIDGQVVALTDDLLLLKSNKHDIDTRIEKLAFARKELADPVYQANFLSRAKQAVEQATSLSGGLVVAKIDGETHLFSEKFSCPVDNISLPELEPRMFSFNSPLGACEKCRGIGTVYKIDPNLILNRDLSINEGAILPLNRFFFNETWSTRLLKQVAKVEGIDLNTPVKRLPKEKLDLLLYGTGKTYRVEGKNRFGRETAIVEKFNGVIPDLEQRFFESGTDEAFGFERYLREETCDQCQGDRLKPEVLGVTIDNLNIAQLSAFAIGDLLNYFLDLSRELNPFEQEITEPIFKEIQTRLSFIKNVGLAYLTISRTAKTLSGGELQRIRLASQIGTGLTGVLYVLDEPSIGLHPKDMAALLDTLRNLRELGNTLIVVEHDRGTMEAADWMLELGPKAGREGGEVVAQGTAAQLKKNPRSLTGQYLSGKKKVKLEEKPLVTDKGELILTGAKEHNLKGITVNIPLGNLVAVTGVSGSGKSTLVVETLYPALKNQLDSSFREKLPDFESISGFQDLERVYLVDQSPIGRTPRSNPATYVGFFDGIREIFAQTQEAKVRGFKKGRFSFNLKGGRCEKCEGAGVIKIEMQFLADVYVTCDVCHGRRYNEETLEVRFKDKAIDEVLAMTVDEAREFFAAHHLIYQKLKLLQEVGLGYITLGQPAPTFSGGEAQRIKLVNELSRRGSRTLYLLDEPTTGLHFFDIQKLLHTLYALVESGNTVLVIEHNLDVVKNCQYVIDLGPEGGDKGGEVIYQGELGGIVKIKESSTGQYLKNYHG